MTMGAHASQLALAAWMAERGELHAALLLTQDAEEAGAGPAALRYRARILTDAWQHNDAIAAWRRVLEVLPEDSEALQGLAVAKRLAASPRLAWLVRPSRLPLALGAAALVLAGATAGVIAWPRGPTALDLAEAAIVERIATVHSDLAALGRIEAAETNLHAATDKLAAALAESRGDQKDALGRLEQRISAGMARQSALADQLAAVATGQASVLSAVEQARSEQQSSIGRLGSALDAAGQLIDALKAGRDADTRSIAELSARVADLEVATTRNVDRALESPADRPPDMQPTALAPAPSAVPAAAGATAP